MANETTTHTSYIQTIPETDECCENIPPVVIAEPETSKLGVQAEDVVGCSFTQLSEETGPLSDTHIISTPAPKGGNDGKKEGSRLSGFQSALTPILKYLNIGNNRPSPESLRNAVSTQKYPKSKAASGRHLSLDLSTTPSEKSGGAKGAPKYLLDFEYLPEMTFLDDTCDPTVEVTTNESALCESAPVTPKVGKENNSTSLNPAKKTSSNPNARTDVLSNSKSSPFSSRILEQYFPEITLLDVSRDFEPSQVGQISSMNITQDTLPQADMEINKAVSGLSEETESSGTIQNEDLSSASLQSVNCVRENAIKTSLEVTQDINIGSVVENKNLPELSGQNEKPQSSAAEEASDTKPVRFTHDRSSSHEMSASLSTSGLECNPSSKRVLSESESMENPDKMEVVNEELVTGCDTESTSKASKQNSDTDEMLSETTKLPCVVNRNCSAVKESNQHEVQNATFDRSSQKSNGSTLTVIQPSNLSASSDCNSSASITCPENKTLDLPTPSVNSTKVCESTDEMLSETTKLPCVVNQNCSAVKESNQHEVQNATFDRSSQKSDGSTTLGEDVTTSPHLQNTFDCKPVPQQNATITLSEINSSDIQHNKLSSPKVCSLTISIKDDQSEVHAPETPKQNATSVAAEANVNMHENPNGTFETNPVLESGSGESEGRDHSTSGLPVTDGLSDASSHQSVEVENNKGVTFNLDETLDLKADLKITSTPMPNCKIFNSDKEREAGQILAAQKKLYGDGPSKPVDQAPSNIVSDRKTFLTQNAPKFLKPPSKVASQLLKNKPGSALPGRFEPVTSGLPLKRQRTQPEPVRNAASQEPQGTKGIPGSYNLRSTTAASKLASFGLQRPQVSGIPSVVQRAGSGLRLLSARSNTISSSSTEKPCGPTANAVTRNPQGKKHHITRGEALPVTKRMRKDAVVPSSITQASASACDTTHKTKNLKQPTASQRSLPAKSQRNDAAETTASCDVFSRAVKQTVTSHRALLTKPQGHGCEKCSALEGQLREQSEEIQRLKEELLKYKKDC